MMRKLRSFAKDNKGSAVIEFIVVFIGAIAVMTFVVEYALYQFFLASVEKAAEAGARQAVVSRPVVNNLAASNPVAGGSTRGQACSFNGGACNPFPQRRCRGSTLANCNVAQFNRILAHMQGYNAAIRRQNVTITYDWAGIGFAGGPPAPMVTVTVANMPFQSGLMGLLIGDDANGFDRLPSRSASMTGEDLN